MKALTCRHRFLSDLPPPAHPAEFEDICEAAASSQSMSDRQAWRNLFRREYRPSLILAVCIPTFQMWTGNNAIVFYVPILFRALGAGKQVRAMCVGAGSGRGGGGCLLRHRPPSPPHPPSPYLFSPHPCLQGALLNAVIIGGVKVLSTCVSIALVDKAGRRKLFMEGGIQMFLSQVCSGADGCGWGSIVCESSMHGESREGEGWHQCQL